MGGTLGWKKMKKGGSGLRSVKGLYDKAGQGKISGVEGMVSLESKKLNPRLAQVVCYSPTPCWSWLGQITRGSLGQEAQNLYTSSVDLL